jgi:hypothetical protein
MPVTPALGRLRWGWLYSKTLSQKRPKPKPKKKKETKKIVLSVDFFLVIIP